MAPMANRWWGRPRPGAAYRRHVQMVFQDPFSSLNPTEALGYILSGRW